MLTPTFAQITITRRPVAGQVHYDGWVDGQLLATLSVAADADQPEAASYVAAYIQHCCPAPAVVPAPATRPIRSRVAFRGPRPALALVRS